MCACTNQCKANAHYRLSRFFQSNAQTYIMSSAACLSPRATWRMAARLSEQSTRAAPMNPERSLSFSRAFTHWVQLRRYSGFHERDRAIISTIYQTFKLPPLKKITGGSKIRQTFRLLRLEKIPGFEKFERLLDHRLNNCSEVETAFCKFE